MPRGSSVMGGQTPDEELEELEKRYAQMEGDRRSFFETSRWTIKQNRDTLANAKVRRRTTRDRCPSTHPGRAGVRECV